MNTIKDLTGIFVFTEENFQVGMQPIMLFPNKIAPVKGLSKRTLKGKVYWTGIIDYPVLTCAIWDYDGFPINTDGTTSILSPYQLRLLQV
jgi:hypothetical protein